MKAMRTRYAVALVLMTVAGHLAAQAAQDGTGDGTGLAVDPERVVVDVAPIEAAVADLPPLPALSFEAPPEPTVVSTALPAAELAPPDVPRDTVDALPSDPTGDQVFFNATLGGGSVNSVLGSINVYRLGDGPQFRLGYDHRGSDGFNFNAPGSGFFRQENTLDTWVRVGEGERLDLQVEGRYADRRFGLQQQPRYYSADSRTLSGSADVTYATGSRSSVGLRLSADDRQRVLAASASGVDSPRAIYRRVQPEVRGRIEWPRLTLEARGDYEGRFDSGSALDAASSAGLTLAVEGVPFDGLTLSAQAATRYRFSDGAFFPAEAGLEYRGAERWGIGLSGGYRVAERSPADLWDQYAVTALSSGLTGQLPLSETVFGAGTADITLVPSLLQVNGQLRWEREQNALTVGAYDDDPAVAAYPIQQEDAERLDGRVAAVVSMGARTTLTAAWNGHGGDRLLGTPRHEGSVTLEVENDPVSGSVTARVPVADTLVTPILDAEVRYQLARDVDIRVFGQDLLGPVEDGGRTSRGLVPDTADPFIVPGFEIGLAVRVTF